MRPSALIRKILELELLEEEVSRQMRRLTRQLQEKNISILGRDDRALDVRIQYRYNGRLHEAIFMRPMLNAEVQAILRECTGEEKK